MAEDYVLQMKNIDKGYYGVNILKSQSIGSKG